MPLPQVPGPLPSYAATDLIPAYTTLIMQQLGDLTDRLAKKPGQPPDERFPQLAGAQAACRAGLARPGDADWREKLVNAVAVTDRLELMVNKIAPRPGGGKPVPFGATRYRQLETVVQMACTINEEAGDDVLMKVFSAPADWVVHLRKRLTGIQAILTERLAQTKPDVVQEIGFMLDPGLPDTVQALAMGTSQHKYIKVKPAILDTGDLSPGLTGNSAGLAAALVHEASHLLPEGSTLDFAYRKGRAFLALPSLYASGNAAHYEEVAMRVLDPDHAAVASGSDETKAMLALQIKVTRAWVRAIDLKDPQATAEQRSPVAALLHAEPARVGPEVSAALFGALFGAMEGVMRLVSDRTELTFAAPARLTAGPDGAIQVTVPKAAPTVAAATAIPLICRHLADTGRIGFRSEELAPYIDGISKYDRTGLNKDIPDLLSQLDQPN